MSIKVKISDKVALANDLPLSVIAGPCVIENRKETIELASKLKKICAGRNINFIFKASYDKANRSSIDSFRGLGIEEGLEILSEIKKKLNIPVLTDVHCVSEVNIAAQVVDVIQIPAFLCRQTDLVVACAKTGLPVNIKKGQFLAPEDMLQVLKKAKVSGNNKLTLTERGASFGYHNLVVDFRAIEIMKQFGYPVVFDATHSVQKPGGLGDKSGGDRQFVLPLAKAAAAVGVAAIFVEVHKNPQKALSDGANSIDLRMFKNMLDTVCKLDKAVK